MEDYAQTTGIILHKTPIKVRLKYLTHFLHNRQTPLYYQNKDSKMQAKIENLQGK